jgi:predicted PurR-regulated permease PerM
VLGILITYLIVFVVVMGGLFQPRATVLWVILLFLVIQQFESDVLGPRITGHAVGLLFRAARRLRSGRHPRGAIRGAGAEPRP